MSDVLRDKPLAGLDHVSLDDPIWSALTTDHARFAEGDALAKRYPPDLAPFAGVIARTTEAYAALRELVPVQGAVALFAPDVVDAPDGLVIERTGSMEQMIATEALQFDGRDAEVATLSSVDAGAMLRLTALTNPGPFVARTHLLGRFVGIRAGNELIAMAGERLRFGGYVEISGVCVHPAHRHEGYARLVTAMVVNRAMQEGLVPFLHVYSGNTAAVSLYTRLKFVVRRRMHVTVLRQAREARD